MRVNGPIKVYNPTDTVPTDAEGGYAGGDSTAAALATLGDQAESAWQTVDQLQVTAATGPVGSPASVTVTGSVPNKTINFVIPRGRDGKDGVGNDAAVQVAMSQQAGTAMRVGVNAGTVGVLVIADSKGAGTGLTDYADRWQNRLVALMRARFPIAGGDTMRGLVPANMSDPYNAMSGRPTTTGTTYPVDTAGLGYNTLQLELGSVLTFPAATWPAGTHTLPIGYHTHSGANGTLEVLIDGVVQTEVNCAGAGEGAPVRTSIPVSAGTHTVSMRPKAGTAPVRPMYIEQRSAATGWHLYDASRPGLAARHVIDRPGAPQGDESFAAAVADLPAVRLAVVALGANDMTISTPAQYGADVRAVVDMVKAGHPTAGVVVVLPAALTDDSAVVDDVQAYHTAARAALVDVPDLSILAETQLVDLTGPNAGAWLADSVHPNELGHDLISRALAGSLIGLDGPTDALSLVEDAIAPAVADAQAAQTSAAQAATNADAAVTLAQQAQAAALEIPDANVSALVGNPVTDTRKALDAGTPPTYAVRNLPHAGMMDDFQRDPHGWVIQGSSTAGASVTRDATQSIFPGGASAKFSVPAGGTLVARLAYSPTLDFTNRVPVVWVRSDDWASLSENLIYFSSNGHVGNYIAGFSRATEPRRLIQDNEWVALTLPWHNLLSGTVNVGAINSIQIRLVAAAGKTPNLWIGGLGSVAQQGRGVVTLTYDDAYRDNYTRALPIASKYGFPGTIGVIAEMVGSANGLTVEMMREMEAVHGWEMVPHAYTIANHDVSYASLGTEASVADALAIRRWMIDHGFTRGQDDFILPRGGFTTEVLTALRKVFASCRTVNGGRNAPGHETLPPANPHRTRAYMISNTETVAQIKAEIDKAIAGNTWLQLLFHSIVPDGTATASTQYEVSKYEEILAYLHAKGVEVRTMSDALRHNPSDKPLVTQDLTGNVRMKNPTPAVTAEVALYDNPTGRGALTIDGDDIVSWTPKGIQMRGHAIELGTLDSSGIYYVASGSPEGVIAARPGSICLSGSAATGPAVWVKRTGTGATGWANPAAPFFASAANFQSAAHAINTQGKALGVMVWDYSIGKPLYARGSTPTSGWQDAMGTVIYTPS